MAPGIKTLAVDGLRVEVERKAIRNLYLRIGPDGAVRVTAPRAVTDGQVEAFVRGKRRWLDQRLRAGRGALPAVGEVVPPGGGGDRRQT